MKNIVMMIFIFLLVYFGCNNNPAGPVSGMNLLLNSTFEINGTPSLKGWKIADSSTVLFSNDSPQGGRGQSIAISTEWYAPWPSNSIYTTVTGLSGNQRYRLSVFGKRTGGGGGVDAYRNRPTIANSVPVISIAISEPFWRYYSQFGTINLSATDTVFITIHGGKIEDSRGKTYFNTCQFEKVD